MQIQTSEFRDRRWQLMQQLPDNSLVLLPAAQELIRNNDAEYPFRQNSDFWYLTGFNEPDAWLAIKKQQQAVQYSLFVRSKDPQMEIWTGYRAGPQGAIEQFAADQAFELSQLQAQMPGLLSGVEHLVLPMTAEVLNRVQPWITQQQKQVRRGVSWPMQWHELGQFLHEMRLIKSEPEIALLRKAAEISSQAHIQAMRACPQLEWEYQLEAELQYQFMRSGARSPAYNSIVGSGNNACVLHYIENNQALKPGDLVLIDAGAEYQNYAGDITRTFPVRGKFSAAQRDLYQIVLTAQKAAIDQLQPGKGCKDFDQAAVRVLTQGMIDLGLLKGSLDGLIESLAYKRYYMHGTGHWLGLDVHDMGAYKVKGEWRPLQPGMVTTVEPGLYISAQDQQAPEALRGLGIRIEDDILITEHGHENLTACCPKEIADIEQLMN